MNDNDLISRWAAKKIVSLMVCVPSVKIPAEHSIDDLPAVDAVPVVRCRDCKYGYKLGLYILCCNRDNSLGRDEALNDENWFCADGERRDKDD